MTREKYKTLLALMTVFIFFYVTSGNWLFIVLAAGLALTGIFSESYSSKIIAFWEFISKKIGVVVSAVFIVLIYYIVLTPISFFYRIYSGDPLLLQKPFKSAYFSRNHVYKPADFEKTW